MADVRWLFVERCKGEMRRVTALDDALDVVVTHERPGGPHADAVPDEFELLQAVELGASLWSSGTARLRPPRRRLDGALGD